MATVEMHEKKLTPIQKQIFSLYQSGKNFEQICKIVYPDGMDGKASGLVRSQMTRMEKYGLNFNKPSATPTQTVNRPKRSPEEAIRAGTTSTQQISNKLNESGKAVYDISKAIQTALMQRKNPLSLSGIPNDLKELDHTDNANTLNPMVLLGCTIQYVKLCGGRMSAHQAIEEVFEALRLFSNDQ